MGDGCIEDVADACSGRLIICAFCLRTSAGVRIRQETSSADEDATLSITGWGISGLEEFPRVGFDLWRTFLSPS